MTLSRDLYRKGYWMVIFWWNLRAYPLHDKPKWLDRSERRELLFCVIGLLWTEHGSNVVLAINVPSYFSLKGLMEHVTYLWAVTSKDTTLSIMVIINYPPNVIH
jgi:hypothetical protein